MKPRCLYKLIPKFHGTYEANKRNTFKRAAILLWSHPYVSCLILLRRNMLPLSSISKYKPGPTSLTCELLKQISLVSPDKPPRNVKLYANMYTPRHNAASMDKYIIHILSLSYLITADPMAVKIMRFPGGQ